MEQKIEGIIADKDKFHTLVYTDVHEAVRELERRQREGVASPVGIPDILRGARGAVLFRQIATPNFEVRRFVSLVDGLGDFTPIFFEYLQDKYVDNNELKYYWGNIPFYSGKGKKGGDKISYMKAIDFDVSRGEKICDVKTLWGESLSDFHHELMHAAYGAKDRELRLFDASQWFHDAGGSAQEYYERFLSLFISDGILFENFLLNEEELGFTRDVFLPAFLKVMEKTGKKPLIVALAPTEIESDLFWHCHPAETKGILEAKAASVHAKI